MVTVLREAALTTEFARRCFALELKVGCQSIGSVWRFYRAGLLLQPRLLLDSLSAHQVVLTWRRGNQCHMSSGGYKVGLEVAQKLRVP